MKHAGSARLANKSPNAVKMMGSANSPGQLNGTLSARNSELISISAKKSHMKKSSNQVEYLNNRETTSRLQVVECKPALATGSDWTVIEKREVLAPHRVNTNN